MFFSAVKFCVVFQRSHFAGYLSRTNNRIKYNSRMSSDWQTVKNTFLSMKPDQKRTQYKCGDNYLVCDQIQTWDEYYKMKLKANTLPEQINVAGDFRIDGTKNVELAKKVSIFTGDIVKLEIDAIVNAANSSLLGGGGVDGAIHRAAGSELKAECRTLHGCKTGEAKITGAYRLPAKYVIHTVGPRGEDPVALTSCYRNCLDLVLSQRLRTVAFPCISTGIYGYPQENAAHIACKQIRSYLEQHGSDINRVIFCLFTSIDQNYYEAMLPSYFPVS